MKLGLHQPDAPGWMPDLHAAERQLSRRADIVHWFMRLGLNYRPDHTRAVVAHGAIPLLTVEPWDSMEAIANGSRDQQIRHLGGQIQRGRHDNLHIRFAHEMNGDWYPWAGGDPEVYQWAYQRFVRIVRNRAPDVRFVWCPNKHYEGAADLRRYWPGEQFVDVMGIDGYDNPQFTGARRSPEELFDKTVAMLRGLSDRPVWICETGSVPGETRAAWLRDLMTWARDREVEAVCYFNASGTGMYQLNARELAVLGDV